MSWLDDLGRVIGLAVMLFLIGALLVGYADSLRRTNRRTGDPAFEALMKAKQEELRQARRDHRHERQRP